MKQVFLFLLVACSLTATGQSYRDSIVAWQHHYRQEFVAEPRSPLKAADTGFIRFFPISNRWRVRADVRLTPEAQAFDMATHSGKTKKFRKYAELRFPNPVARGLRYHTLIAYERINPPAGDTMSPLSLFIPFNDETNLEETYGGGRYLDIPKAAIKDGQLIVDFNKAYNPWCAFGEGYSCPIPPAENKLNAYVRAGERAWIKKPKDN